jgi:hypothetical protein
MTDRMLMAMAVLLCLLLAGSLVASARCKSGSVEWRLCGALTDTELHLGPALHRW